MFHTQILSFIEQESMHLKLNLTIGIFQHRVMMNPDMTVICATGHES